MRVCLGQINTTPGDFEGNLDAMLKGMRAAVDGGCTLIAFPELSIPGYLSQDLLYQPRYIERNLDTLKRLCAETENEAFRDLCVVAGYIEPNPGAGKPFFNAAAIVRNGELIANYRKQLLPFYDVFDEARYFEPGEDLAVSI